MRSLTRIWKALRLGALGAALAAAGCGSDQSWTKEGSWQEDEPRQQPGPSATLGDDGNGNALTPAAPPSSQDPRAWVGVRHDLSMRPGTPRKAACGCLAVEVGMPGKQAFLWNGQVPTIGADATVVAVSAHGVDCPAEPDEDKRRASISAVDRDGDDVVIEIEDLPEGRPLALGAIIPKPGPSGALYLKARDKKVRYLPPGQRCKAASPQ